MFQRYRYNKKHNDMAKLYSKKSLVNSSKMPKNSTIKFLLAYSQALKVVKVGRMNIELIAN